MRQVILGRAACLLLTSSAQAAISGEDLIKSCDSNEQFAGGFCFGFIAGIADGLDNISFCIPLDVTLSQERATIQKYLREHPEQAKRQASQLVVDTFKRAYPCKTE